MTGPVDVMFVKIGTSVIVPVTNITDYHETDLFVSIEQIEDPITPLRAGCLSHVTALWASISRYGFHYTSSILSVTFYPLVSAGVVSMPSIGSMTVGGQILYNSAKLLFLNRCRRLEAMQQLQVEGDVGWFQ